MPPQFTTKSVAMNPLSPVCSATHDTPETTRCPPFMVSWTSVTLTCSCTVAPRIRAPLASASAMLAGSPCPSFGR